MMSSFFIIILFLKQIVILTEINESFNEYLNFNVDKNSRTCLITWCILHEKHSILKFCCSLERVAFEQKILVECEHFKTVVDAIKLIISYFLRCVRRLELRYLWLISIETLTFKFFYQLTSFDEERKFSRTFQLYILNDLANTRIHLLTRHICKWNRLDANNSFTIISTVTSRV